VLLLSFNPLIVDGLESYRATMDELVAAEKGRQIRGIVSRQMPVASSVGNCRSEPPLPEWKSAAFSAFFERCPGANHIAASNASVSQSLRRNYIMLPAEVLRRRNNRGPAPYEYSYDEELRLAKLHYAASRSSSS